MLYFKLYDIHVRHGHIRELIAQGQEEFYSIVQNTSHFVNFKTSSVNLCNKDCQNEILFNFNRFLLSYFSISFDHPCLVHRAVWYPLCLRVYIVHNSSVDWEGWLMVEIYSVVRASFGKLRLSAKKFVALRATIIALDDCNLTLSPLKATNVAVLEATTFKIGHVLKSRNLVIMVY